MRVTSHGQHLIALTRFAPIFPIGSYLVREEDGFTLIDTGIVGSADGILDTAQEQGAPIRRIVLTHAHFDHVGSLDALHAALPSAEVMISARDARFLRGDTSLDAWEPTGHLHPITYPKVETRPTRELAAGDRVGSLEVVAAPGHTPGQIALLDTRDRTLIAGDAFKTQAGVDVASVVRPRFPVPAIATWHKPTALASAHALRLLAPSRLAVGHGPVLEDPLPAVNAAIVEAERKTGR